LAIFLATWAGKLEKGEKEEKEGGRFRSINNSTKQELFSVKQHEGNQMDHFIKRQMHSML
jgi:hypothetical protein